MFNSSKIFRLNIFGYVFFSSSSFLFSLCRLLGTPQPRTLYFLVEAKSRVREVYTQTCLHFARQGMLDTELFGLAVPIGKFHFVPHLIAGCPLTLLTLLTTQVGFNSFCEQYSKI